jgi:hypothetical protein
VFQENQPFRERENGFIAQSGLIPNFSWHVTCALTFDYCHNIRGVIMKTATGIFNSRAAAEQALQRLHESGFTEEEISFLTPGTSAAEINAVPTAEGEQPGMGPALGGVVGGAIGLSGGMGVAAAVSSLFLPGVGPVLAIGFAGAALAGAAGALGGAAVGGALEDALTEGLPKDELYFYIDALKKGRTVIVCRTDDEQKLEEARRTLEASADSLDAAREQTWIGTESPNPSSVAKPAKSGNEKF